MNMEMEREWKRKWKRKWKTEMELLHSHWTGLTQTTSFKGIIMEKQEMEMETEMEN